MEALAPRTVALASVSKDRDDMCARDLEEPNVWVRTAVLCDENCLAAVLRQMREFNEEIKNVSFRGGVVVFTQEPLRDYRNDFSPNWNREMRIA